MSTISSFALVFPFDKPLLPPPLKRERFGGGDSSRMKSSSEADEAEYGDPDELPLAMMIVVADQCTHQRISTRIGNHAVISERACRHYVTESGEMPKIHLSPIHSISTFSASLARFLSFHWIAGSPQEALGRKKQVFHGVEPSLRILRKKSSQNLT